MGEATHPHGMCTSGHASTGEPHTHLHQGGSEDLGSSLAPKKREKYWSGHQNGPLPATASQMQRF